MENKIINKIDKSTISFILAFTIVLARFSGLLASGLYYGENKSNNYLNADFNIITHAGGSVDEMFYINSTETIAKYYDMGNRVFEYDFALSSDNEFIGVHNWGRL